MLDRKGEANSGLIVLVVVLIIAIIAVIWLTGIGRGGGAEEDAELEVDVGAVPALIELA